VIPDRKSRGARRLLEDAGAEIDREVVAGAFFVDRR
jgi:hypothetical protein